MTSRDVIPSTLSHPLTTDHVPSVRPHGGMHNYASDHSLRPKNHELGHSSAIKPVPHSPNMHGPGRGQMTKRGSGGSFFSSDDSALTKQIVATHALEIEELNVKPVLSIVMEILRLGKPFTDDVTNSHMQLAPNHAHLDTADDKKLLHSSNHDEKVLHAGLYHGDKIFHGLELEHDSDIVKMLAFPINKTSWEIVCKCASGGEAHSVTMDLLRSLTNYSWDAKVVITFAAFAINYGEFWLVEHLHTHNALAKNIAILKDLPETMGHSDELKKKFDAILDLLNVVLKVTHSIIEFKELPTAYIGHDTPEMMAATAHIPTAVYWIIRSLLACASILLNLIGSGHEYITSTSESWEILSLAHKLSVIMEHLQMQLSLCKDLIERKKGEDAYIAFKRLMETTHIDNMKVLRAMIRGREDQRPLYDGSRRTNERIETLRLKYVLLLISDLDLPHEELNVLHMIYNQQGRTHEYEVLWLPVGDHTNTLQHDPVFYDLRNNNMPWYSVDHPSLIEPVAIRYIREVWKFVHMPMLVVLDPQGRPSNLDALPMMWIWGSEAFPFTKFREVDLWADVKAWNIQLLADAIDPRIPEWMSQNKVVCLYGGEDIEWIRKFTHWAREAAIAMRVPLEMLYVGKRNPKEKVRRCHEEIHKDKLSHIFSLNEYYDYVWYFWVRLWSMWNSKKHIGMTVENDVIMQEIMDLLTYDSTEKGWAVFSQGNFRMTKGQGDIVLPTLENYTNWAYKVETPERFVEVLDEEMKQNHPEHHCNRLILPGHSGYVPERIVCSECGKTMDKYVMYRCCTD